MLLSSPCHPKLFGFFCCFWDGLVHNFLCLFRGQLTESLIFFFVDETWLPVKKIVPIDICRTDF